jgi:Ca2+-binding EF-hand superfamily protein
LDDVYLIFRRYDRDNDGKLNFNEFSKLLVPHENTDIVAQRNDIRLSSDSVDLLRRVLKAHLSIE